MHQCLLNIRHLFRAADNRFKGGLSSTKNNVMPRYFENPYEDFQADDDVNKEAGVYSNADAAKRVTSIMEAIERHRKEITDVDDGGGLYTGPAGVAFAQWYAAAKKGAGDDEAFNRRLMDRAAETMDDQVRRLATRNDRSRDKVGFLVGHSGIHAVAAVVARAKGDEKKALGCVAAFNEIAPLAEKGENKSNELLVGRAGYLCGALWLRSQLGGEAAVPLEPLKRICREILRDGEAYAKSVKSPSPLMFQYFDTQYLGAAHGLCSILQMLLSVPGGVDDPTGLIRRSVDYLQSVQSADGNFPCATDEVGHDRAEPLVHWCHGAPGTIYLFAKAYLVYGKKEDYLRTALRCGECIWSKGLLLKGPGICHGIAGSGYAFLLLFRLTGDLKHLYRAQRFAQFMETKLFVTKSRTPDAPYSLYEGLAGTACFLTDLADPKGAAFPFFDAF